MFPIKNESVMCLKTANRTSLKSRSPNPYNSYRNEDTNKAYLHKKSVFSAFDTKYLETNFPPNKHIRLDFM